MAASPNHVAFSELKPVLATFAPHLVVSIDTPTEYTLVTKSPSPFPQHKGQPLFFASVKIGKAYTSFHLLPLYMCPELSGMISAALKKRMQGKACFNFKNSSDPNLLLDLRDLTEKSLEKWRERKWL